MNSIKNMFFSFIVFSFVGFTTHVQSMNHRSLGGPTPFQETRFPSPPVASPTSSSSLGNPLIAPRPLSPVGPALHGNARPQITIVQRSEANSRPAQPNPSLLPFSEEEQQPPRRDWLDAIAAAAAQEAVDRAIQELPRILPHIEESAQTLFGATVHPLLPTQEGVSQQVNDTITHTAQTASDATVETTRAIAPHLSQLLVGGTVASAWGIGGALTACNALNRSDLPWSTMLFRTTAGAGMALGSVAAYSWYTDYLRQQYELRDADRRKNGDL